MFRSIHQPLSLSLRPQLPLGQVGSGPFAFCPMCSRCGSHPQPSTHLNARSATPSVNLLLKWQTPDTTIGLDVLSMAAAIGVMLLVVAFAMLAPRQGTKGWAVGQNNISFAPAIWWNIILINKLFSLQIRRQPRRERPTMMPTTEGRGA